ncbi:MAG: hypothetical protein LBI54_02985, partial [Lachnospiraceae bacterium]|nr:hypothetical protein [Lachnospiraceae bacterium]
WYCSLGLSFFALVLSSFSMLIVYHIPQKYSIFNWWVNNKFIAVNVSDMQTFYQRQGLLSSDFHKLFVQALSISPTVL